MVEGQPDIEPALAEFVAFAGDDVLVAHNAPFDLRFLNYERRRLTGRYFTQPWLDTLILARRLLRGRVERNDLSTLAEWAGTAVRPMHRALPDAEATAELLVTFVEMLAERGIDTLQRAVSFAGTSAPRHSHKLALAEDLPALPGVYLMRDRDGEVLYVGKAANLRRRVRSYFGPGGRHGRLIGRALEGLHRLDHEVCGSEFEALLRESRLLKELRPPCNRRGLGHGGRYLKLTLDEPFPRLYAVPRAGPDGAAYFGPVRSDRTLRLALDALHRLYPLRRCHPICAPGAAPSLLHPAAGCAGPCVTASGPDAYAVAVDEIRRLLAGDPGAAGALLARLAAAAARGELHPDGDLRESLAGLMAALSALARARWTLAMAAVVVEPAREPGTAVAFFICRGRVRHRVDLPARGWRRAARRGLAALRAADAEPPAPMAPDGLDEAMIVADRLRERRDAVGAIRLEPGWDEDAALAAIGVARRAVASAAVALEPEPERPREAVPA
jgi:DNA polymerase-3 subunit epsilon